MHHSTAPVRVAATRPAESEHPLPVPRRNPTADRAISRADRPDPWARPATAQQLRERLDLAVRADDGAGLRLIAALLARSA